MLKIIQFQIGQFPKYICYDNSCQLQKFCVNRANHTDKSRFFDEYTYIIDRLHVKGHVARCREIYPPNLIRELDNAQTMICEQRNFWISGYKHNVKHMNQYRFHFFYIIFTYFNEIKEEGLLNIANTNDVYKPSKRLFTAISNSDDDNTKNDNQMKPANKKLKINEYLN